jgi:predicted RNA binding protein YcfA (HicA-like mRNA interferase family)
LFDLHPWPPSLFRHIVAPDRASLTVAKCAIVCIYTSMKNRREIIAKLEGDGWFKVAQKGSHVQFKHPTKPGRVTVPYPNRDIPLGTLRSIEKQAGLKLR